MLKTLRRSLGAGTTLSLMLVTAAQAAGTNMPWEQPLQQILDSIQGPVAKIVAPVP